MNTLQIIDSSNQTTKKHSFEETYLKLNCIQSLNAKLKHKVINNDKVNKKRNEFIYLVNNFLEWYDSFLRFLSQNDMLVETH